MDKGGLNMMKSILNFTFLIISLFGITNIANAQWIQTGQDIDGETADDCSGWSVSLSSDGSIVAIGAYLNDGNGVDAGHIRVYEYQAGNWTQLGNDIDGEIADDNSGWSVSLSSDGSIVAIGAHRNDGNGLFSGHVRIYEYQAGNWIQLGNDIDGEAAGDNLGWSVSLSSDGSIVAIGAYGNDGNGSNSGHVRVYEYQTGNWNQIGNDIDGEAIDDRSGCSVSLSSDGSIVAIGASHNDDNQPSSGHVRVYEYQAGNWVKLGNDIEGEATLNHSGYSVSLNSVGSIVAIGAIYNSDNGLYSGHVRVYEYSGSNWIQLGNDIDGEAAEDNSGNSVSLSSDGSIVAIGAHGNSDNGIRSGHVRVYNYSVGNWIQLSNDIDGESAENHSGRSVSLSSDGSIVAIGADGNSGNGAFSGHVRVYGNPSVGIIENISNTEFELYPNPTTGKITIQAENIIGIEVMDITGKTIKNLTGFENLSGLSEIDLSKNPKGIYIIKVTTSKGVTVEKVILE